MKYLPSITERPYPIDMHAKIKQVLPINDDYRIAKNEHILVHFAENESMWQRGVIRIEINNESAEVSIDALMSAIFTAYDPSLLRKSVGFFEHILFRVKSFFLKQ